MNAVVERVEKQYKKPQPEKIHTLVRRGEIWIADISGVEGSMQSGINRPCVILQNDVGNRFSPTVIVAPLTTQSKAKIPTHVEIPTSEGVGRDSIVLLEQIRTIDQWCLLKRITRLSEEKMQEVNIALAKSVGLIEL